MGLISLDTLGIASSLHFIGNTLGDGIDQVSGFATPRLNLGFSTAASALQFVGNSFIDATGWHTSYTPPLPAPPFDKIYAFGDSLSDAGNDYIATGGKTPVSPPYYKGHFTNGLTWVEDLSRSLGLGSLAPSLAGTANATDYAFGHAETGGTAVHAAADGDLYAPGRISQLSLYEAAHQTPQPNALYTLTIGSVDVFDAISAFPSAPFKALDALHQAVRNIDTFVTHVAADGGRNFLVLTVPDLGKTPAYTNAGPAASQLASSLSALFNAGLSGSLQDLAAQKGLRMDIVDTYSLLDKGIANPGLYGFTNVTDPVWTGNYTDANSGTLRAQGVGQQNRYLFWDQVHPTAAGHAVLAAAAADSLMPVA